MSGAATSRNAHMQHLAACRQVVSLNNLLVPVPFPPDTNLYIDQLRDLVLII